MRSLGDGRYLSTYFSPPGVAHALQAWVRHDHSVAVWKLTGDTVELEHYWEFERISGMKSHGIAFRNQEEADAFLNQLLSDAGLDRSEVRGLWGVPGMETTAPYTQWQDVPLPMHTLSHLATAVFADTAYLNAGGTLYGMAIDDTPDLVLEHREPAHWYAGALVRDGELTVFPIESPAALYSTAVHWFGLREGTLMALATACAAELRVNVDPAVAEYAYFRGDSERDKAILDALQGAGKKGVCRADDRFTEQENLISAVMKEVQSLGYAVLRRNIERAIDEHGFDPAQTRLALAGGYALNGPTNRQLLDAYDFSGFEAAPVVSDTGQAYGLGLLGFMGRKGPWRSFKFPGAYLGRPHVVGPAVDRWREFVVADTEWDYQQVVEDLQRDIVGWFQGRAEVGPRALGNRSLLGDPTRMETKLTLNAVKRRQWWRPVAPVVLREKADDWFASRGPSPYMLQTMDILSEQANTIPGVAHLDWSARAQTVTADENPVLYELLRAFDDSLGVPLLANTSMNDKEEPIVDTPDEAIAFCLSRGVQVLYIDDRRLELRVGAKGAPTRPLPRTFEPFSQADSTERARIFASANPHGLASELLMGWLYSPELARYDLATSDGAQAVAEQMIAKFETDPAFEQTCRQRLQKVRQLTDTGVPVYRGGWVNNDA